MKVNFGPGALEPKNNRKQAEELALRLKEKYRREPQTLGYVLTAEELDVVLFALDEYSAKAAKTVEEMEEKRSKLWRG